jgi:5-methylcytosine-specific restriction endonuclease McrA
VKIYRKQYHQRNKEAFAANYKAWAEKNADKVKNYRRRYWPQWKKRNLERYRAYQSDYQRIRDSRLKAQTVERIDRFKVYERDEGICGICKSYVDKERFTIDHIFPLSKGGLHTYSNVQIAHSLCNSRKGATI